MPETIEVSDELVERIEAYLEEGTSADFLEGLVSIYETEGAFIREGYSE